MTEAFLEDEIYGGDDEKEEILEYISGILSARVSEISNSKNVAELIEKINKIFNQVLDKINEEKFNLEIAKRAIDELKSNTIRSIILSPIENELYNVQKFDAENKNILSVVLSEFGILDGDLKKGQHQFLLESDILEKRKKIIKGLYKNNYNKYLYAFKEKLFLSGKKIFKYLLAEKTNKISDSEIEELVLYLFSISESGLSYEKSEYLTISKKITDADLLKNYLKNAHKDIYSILDIVYKKSELDEDDKAQMKSYLDMKSLHMTNPEVLTLAKDIYYGDFPLEGKPNNFSIYLYKLENELANVFNFPARIKISVGENKKNNILDDIKTRAISICTELYEEERKIVREINSLDKQEYISKAIKKIKSPAIYLFLGLILIYGLYFFFNIESIYKNQFLPKSTITMEAIPFPKELKDSLNPTVNEIRQRERLDSVKDLNTRYFKVFEIFLKPDVSPQELLSVLPTLSIAKEIKDLNKINIARKYLVNIVPYEKWEKDFNLLFGENILTEPRAYGAISNFLIPSLSHFILKDASGLPLRDNGMLILGEAIPELNILKTSPGNYLNNYDKNYKNIILNIDFLLKELDIKKKNLFNEYFKSSFKKQSELRLVLNALSHIECRLKDLKKQVLLRHDYIVEHDTYRAITD